MSDAPTYIRSHILCRLYVLTREVNMHLDFDNMTKLYKDDPEQFELETRAVLDDYINSLSSEDKQRRARGIQFRLNIELNKIHDPIARMNKMVELFWKQVRKLDEVLKHPKEVLAELHNAESATIISFPVPTAKSVGDPVDEDINPWLT